MGSLKNCKKRLKQSSTLFRICCILILIAVILDFVSFCSHFWIVDINLEWNYGLWRLCTVDINNGTQGSTDSKCQSIRGQRVWTPYMQSNTTDMLPPPWFQAVQTSEVFGIVCLAICGIMSFSLLCYTSNPRLEKLNAFVCALAGIFIDIGLVVIIWKFKVRLYFFGYSFWTALVTSLVCLTTTVLLIVDICRRTKGNSKTLRRKAKGKDILLKVCGCSSSKNDTTTPTDSRLTADSPRPAYSALRQKPQKHSPVFRTRPASEVIFNSSSIRVPTDVHKRASEGHLGTRVFLDVPRIKVSQPSRRRMSCPERSLYTAHYTPPYT